MPTIRDYAPDDLSALYRIALATGDGGGNAAALFYDPDLLGHIYVAPYAIVAPELALVVEDTHGVAGYCVGALLTAAFEQALERRWWPTLRDRYPAPSSDAPSGVMRDADLVALIHHPPRAPDWLVRRHPSHLHINLLPRLQGLGCGRRLVAAWRHRARALGSPGFHLGVDPANVRAIGFYQAIGLAGLHAPGTDPATGARWFGEDHPGEI